MHWHHIYTQVTYLLGTPTSHQERLSTLQYRDTMLPVLEKNVSQPDGLWLGPCGKCLSMHIRKRHLRPGRQAHTPSVGPHLKPWGQEKLVPRADNMESPYSEGAESIFGFDLVPRFRGGSRPKTRKYDQDQPKILAGTVNVSWNVPKFPELPSTPPLPYLKSPFRTI